jgi:nitroreductase
MELFETIFSRQSIGDVRPDPVPRELVEKLLAAAVQAPNHYKVRPWCFIVISGAARNELGEVMAQSFGAQFPSVPPEALEKERAKALRAPLIIAVGVDKPSLPKVLEVENIAAVAAACQNLLLAATALGLGAKWRTGATVLDPRVKEWLGLEADQHLLGMIYIGYPAFEPQLANRPGFEEHTTWKS